MTGAVGRVRLAALVYAAAMHTRFVWLRAALAVAAILLMAPSTSLACSCRRVPLEPALEGAHAVFEGLVTHVEPGPGDDLRTAKLRVVRVWKGSSHEEEVTVLTPRDSAMCGFPFEQGQGYLVFADLEEGQLHVSLCSRTQPIEQAGEDLQALGAGVTPVHLEEGSEEAGDGEPKALPESGSKGKGGFASCSAAPGGTGAGAGLLALLVVGLLGFRRGWPKGGAALRPGP